jgi:hypothetical protein
VVYRNRRKEHILREVDPFKEGYFKPQYFPVLVELHSKCTFKNTLHKQMWVRRTVLVLILPEMKDISKKQSCCE